MGRGSGGIYTDRFLRKIDVSRWYFVENSSKIDAYPYISNSCAGPTLNSRIPLKKTFPNSVNPAELFL
jgi:hypothetical protein